MKINYGISITTVDPSSGRKHRESKNDSIELDVNWDNNNDHTKIRQAIRDKHPGSMLHGYCPAPENKIEVKTIKVFYVSLVRELIGYCIRIEAYTKEQVEAMAAKHYGGLWCAVYDDIPEGTTVIGYLGNANNFIVL